MFKNFEIIIGIENHVELKTISKIFAPGKVEFGAKPNTMVSEVEMGYPGALPTVNKKGVELAILAVNALNMELDPLLKFDRKNYFYPDLTKGFQITQQFNPIGLNGYVEIKLSDGNIKKIEIERLHIEEDTAKQMHKNDLTYIDYNRSGVGLIEIVSKPVLRSSDEAIAYIEKLQEILLFLGVSDVKMSEGSFRSDVNISIRPFGANKYSNRVEVKNLNSLVNIKKAIEFEVKRHIDILLNNEEVSQETRRFDETLQQTVSMRSKTDAIDYKYFTEPNIAPIKLKKEWIDNIIKNSPELADSKRKRYINEYNISLVDANVLLLNLELTNFFEETINYTSSYNKVVNYILGDIQFELNKSKLDIINTKITPIKLANIINNLDNGIISSKHVKTILPLAMETDEDIESIINRLNLKLISDESVIKEFLKPIFNKLDNSLLEQYENRPERVEKTIMGQLMKITEGNVNPDIAINVIKEYIKKELLRM